ncbi:heterokaryon incompatibility protein-domain-containing protein, partial [Diaporthe sp. PMI_573]
MARHWYHQCLSHSTCRNWREDSRGLPTRLVRVWRPDNESPDFISAELCETSHLPLSTAYATLSHRWGDNQIFQLRQSSIEKLRQSIPFNELPRVFQDAMYTTIELGINYIWVDSLCIIQDLKEDWNHEAKRMGDVYQYAACNIAATGYQHSSIGLFAERNALTTTSFEGLYIRGSRGAFYSAVGLSILNSRAWVAQERALSPGIVYFTPQMMWWECNHLVANEVFPTGSIYGTNEEWLKTCSIRSLTVESEPEDIYAFWRKFISLYAGYKLTYEKDRFPAAAGIARTLDELTNDNFVAGFWEGDLIRSLILTPRGRIEDVPTKQRASSWSWASL